jgi:hypothetical protein
MTKFIIGFIALGLIMVAIPGLLAWSGSRRRTRVGLAGGVAVIRMPKGHWAVLGMMALLPGAAIAGLSIASEWAPGNEANGWIMAAFGALGSGAGAAYLFALEARGQLRVGPEALEKVGALGRFTFRWTDVAALKFNPVNNWFFMTLADGRRVYVTEAVDGIGDFAELALRHLPKAVLAAAPEAVEALEEAAGS